MARPKGVARKNNHEILLDAARKVRDAFNYNPGHSDLDAEQPIHITIPLGVWRDLNYAVTCLDMEKPLP